MSHFKVRERESSDLDRVLSINIHLPLFESLSSLSLSLSQSAPTFLFVVFQRNVCEKSFRIFFVIIKLVFLFFSLISVCLQLPTSAQLMPSHALKINIITWAILNTRTFIFFELSPTNGNRSDDLFNRRTDRCFDSFTYFLHYEHCRFHLSTSRTSVVFPFTYEHCVYLQKG